MPHTFTEWRTHKSISGSKINEAQYFWFALLKIIIMYQCLLWILKKTGENLSRTIILWQESSWHWILKIQYAEQLSIQPSIHFSVTLRDSAAYLAVHLHFPPICLLTVFLPEPHCELPSLHKDRLYYELLITLFLCSRKHKSQYMGEWCSFENSHSKFNRLILPSKSKNS